MAFVRTKVELKRTRRTATCGIRDNEVLLVGGQPAEQRRLLGLVEPAVLLLRARVPPVTLCPLIHRRQVNAVEHVHRPETQHSHVVIGNELAEADAGQRDAADEAKPRRVMLVVSATYRAAAS